MNKLNLTVKKSIFNKVLAEGQIYMWEKPCKCLDIVVWPFSYRLFFYIYIKATGLYKTIQDLEHFFLHFFLNNIIFSPQLIKGTGDHGPKHQHTQAETG